MSKTTLEAGYTLRFLNPDKKRVIRTQPERQYIWYGTKDGRCLGAFSRAEVARMVRMLGGK